MWDLHSLLHRIRSIVDSHAVGPPGLYRRWRNDALAGASDLRPNPYGTADAANLLYSLGDWPRPAKERAGFVEALSRWQDPESGLFHEATHHSFHTTAHCIGALELFDARPRHRLAALTHLEGDAALETFLGELDWRDDPWLASHQGAGVFAARVTAGEASSDFQARYFAWLSRESDPDTGLWRRGCVEPPFAWGDNRFPHLAGTFHYLFNYEWARQPLPYAEALVDTCLSLLETREYPLGASLGFAEIDWVYCLGRALAKSHHRPGEAEAALRSFADEYRETLESMDWDTNDGANDLHNVFGAVCALAELQRLLPGELRSAVPLRLVLDRRPFI